MQLLECLDTAANHLWQGLDIAGGAAHAAQLILHTQHNTHNNTQHERHSKIESVRNRRSNREVSPHLKSLKQCWVLHKLSHVDCCRESNEVVVSGDKARQL